MPISSPLDILLAHDHWATRKVLDACAPLSREQFHRQFPMGLGSLHHTARHILLAMRVWTDTLHGRPLRPSVELREHTVPELLMLLDESAAELTEIAHAHPVDETIARPRDGKVWKYTRGGILTHVTTHGMYHRAQCINMLRQLGVSPLPQSSVVEWMREVDQPAE